MQRERSSQQHLIFTVLLPEYSTTVEVRKQNSNIPAELNVYVDPNTTLSNIELGTMEHPFRVRILANLYKDY